MNVRLLLSALFLGLCISPIFAQQLRPLMGYEGLREAPLTKGFADFDKMDCSGFDASTLQLVLPGDDRAIVARPDTLTADGNGPYDDYRCAGCDEAGFGTVTFANDTLFYGANAGAMEGLDTFQLTACNAAGDCTDELTVIVLVQRPGADIDLGGFAVDARGELDIPVPADNLPGGATCRTIEACDDGYPGRERRFAFATELEDGNDFRYVAAGYGGQDAVCVTLCNDFGLCDTYTARITVNVDPVSLPFFDDFSYGGSRPSEQLWQDRDVLVNRNFAVDPPSIGVATFDGVDFSGQAYPPGSGGRITVVRDYLTSVPVRLSGQSETNLNFWLQPRGLGNRPETQDSFLVQFLDQAGNWNTVFERAGLLTTVPGNSVIPFEGTTIPVANEYLYNGFQFRFASKSSEQGAVDMWHLDYVKLSRTSNTLVTNDVAVVNPPGFLLQPPYSSMPIRHLRVGGTNLLNGQLEAVLKNNFNAALTVSQASQLIVSSDVPFSPNLVQSDFTAAFINIGGGSNDIAGGEQVSGRVSLSSLNENYDQLISYLFEDVDENASTKLRASYDLDVPSQPVGFAPGILTNDEAERFTCFDEYMAYDDGTAENIIEGQEGTTILQRYTAFVDDQLTGIQIRIPRGLGGLGNQDLRLVVYTGEEQPEELIFEQDFELLYAGDFFRDSLGGFSTYVFPDDVAISAGKFYVGWEQQRASRDIGVGYDRNWTFAPGNQWFNTGSGWTELTGTLTGAIMIRPLLAGFGGFTTSTDEVASGEQLVDVFPNPTNNLLHLRPRPGVVSELSYKLYNLTGALLAQDRNADQLSLGHLPAGIYLLEVSDGRRSSRHKIVRR